MYVQNILQELNWILLLQKYSIPGSAFHNSLPKTCMFQVALKPHILEV